MYHLPKRLYYVKILGALDENYRPVRMYEKGGGKYTSLEHAKNQRDRLREQNKLDARVFMSQELEWTEYEG